MAYNGQLKNKIGDGIISVGIDSIFNRKRKYSNHHNSPCHFTTSWYLSLLELHLGRVPTVGVCV